MQGKKLFRVAKGGRYLAAASSPKHIGTNRESDLRWSEGKELPGYPSVGVQAAQRQRSSVEQGISASACKTSGVKTIAAGRGKP